MARGNVASVTDKEAGGRKATKAKAKVEKPEPEKVETAAAPEPAAAPETNGEQQVDELVESTTEEAIPGPEATPAPAPTGVQQKIAKGREELPGRLCDNHGRVAGPSRPLLYPQREGRACWTIVKRP